MREIKFRGKRIEDGKWIYGYLADEDYINNINEVAIPSEEVAPDTVGQYTGHIDKNVTEIYEDDVLHFTKYGNECTAVVKWNKEIGAWCIQLSYATRLGNRPLGEWLKDECLEVIGNIHDNPELF